MAAADGGVRIAGHTPHIVPAGAGYRAVILALQGSTQVHAPRQTAHAVLLAGDGPTIDAVHQHRLGLVAAAKGEPAGRVVLRVQVEFNGHGTGNAAHVAVSLHGSQVGAVRHLALPGGGDVLIGGVLNDALQAAFSGVPGVIHCVQQKGEYRVKLPVDGPQVGGQGAVPGLKGAVQPVHLLQQAAHGIIKAVAGLPEVLPQGGELRRTVLGERIHRIANGIQRPAQQPPDDGGGVRGLLQCIQGVSQLAGQSAGAAQGLLELRQGIIQIIPHSPQGAECLTQLLPRRQKRADGDGATSQILQKALKGVQRAFQPAYRRGQPGGGLPQLLHRETQVPRGPIAGVHRAAQRIQSVPQLAGQALQPPAHVGQIVQGGRNFVQRAGDVGGQGVDGADVLVGKIGNPVQQLLGAVLGAAGVVSHGAELGGDAVSGALRVVQRAVNQVFQGVQLLAQLLQRVPARVHKHIGLRLAHNAAHVLPSVDGAAVGTAGQIAVLPPGDAAGVVPHMGVAHRAAIDAALHHAAGIAHDATGIKAAVQQVVGFVVRRGLLLQDGSRIRVHQVHIGFLPGQIHSGAAFTFEQQPQIPARNAAGDILAADRTGDGTTGNLTGDAVVSGDAAHGGIPLNHAVKGTALQGSCVVAHDASHGGAGTPGGHRTLDGQVPYQPAGLDIAEQPQGGTGGGETQPGDGVSLA